MLARVGAKITFGATPLTAGTTAVLKVIFSFLDFYHISQKEKKTFGATPLTAGTTAVLKVVFMPRWKSWRMYQLIKCCRHLFVLDFLSIL